MTARKFQNPMDFYFEMKISCLFMQNQNTNYALILGKNGNFGVDLTIYYSTRHLTNSILVFTVTYSRPVKLFNIRGACWIGKNG